jgi:hypothetical protein
MPPLRPLLVLAVAAALSVSGGGASAEQRPADEIRPRVAHHLSHVDQQAQHFEGVLARECPRFRTTEEWRAYLEGEVERVVLMLAHLEQAWAEAKRTGDDEVRRAAKAPRRRTEEARALVGKLRQCAAGNGAAFSTERVWRRIEREVPVRQADVALPR